MAGQGSASPKYDPQAPNHREHLIMDHQEMKPPNSMFLKVAETARTMKGLHAACTGVISAVGAGKARSAERTPGVALTRALLSQKGGGGT